MTFTEPELHSIIKIIGIDRISLNQVLAAYENYITSDLETAVREELTRWTDADLDNETDKIRPMGTNKGLDSDPDRLAAKIRGNIARLLWLTDYVNTGSAQGVLIRG